MKCQHCGLHLANVHYTSNINGRVIEQHLCTTCAQLGQTATNPLDELFGNAFFATPFSYGSRLFERPRNEQAGVATITPPHPLAKQIVIDADETLTKRRTLNMRKAQLKDAVAAEQYEEAAKLRDEIYRLEE